jgi:hypothetical protein
MNTHNTTNAAEAHNGIESNAPINTEVIALQNATTATEIEATLSLTPHTVEEAQLHYYIDQYLLRYNEQADIVNTTIEEGGTPDVSTLAFTLQNLTRSVNQYKELRAASGSMALAA